MEKYVYTIIWENKNLYIIVHTAGISCEHRSLRIFIIIYTENALFYVVNK